MAKIGYIMAISQYDRLEEDRKWMNDYGCIRIVEESDENERNRPLWKQLMVALQRGDELVISKFSNALRGSRELATFLEFCRVKVIRIVSIRLSSTCMFQVIPLMKYGEPAVSEAEALCSAYLTSMASS